jgi:nucleotide-binding universal stress UspA family protein/hemerythrin-like domain-containing protein
MYRHLLVPIDGTDLSVEVIGNAVALARVLAARITFFHAVPDSAGLLHGDPEVLRLTAHDEFEYVYHHGKAGELLAKAEAAARALGVPCASRQAVSDRPAQAVIEAARACGSDLIFMASHGHSKLGMLFGSETLSVLMNAGLPVLVSSTGELPAPARSIAIIRDEHRSLAAVMHAWMQALADARQAGSAADPAQMRTILHYLQQFPLQLHHPKEEDHLFARLRERTDSCHAELDELERQHDRDAQLVAELAQHVEALAAGEPAARIAATRTLEGEVVRYARFLWDHLGREEGVILPAAQRHLLAEDWASIDAAFAQNRDPMSGASTDKEFRQLFSRIVHHAVA